MSRKTTDRIVCESCRCKLDVACQCETLRSALQNSDAPWRTCRCLGLKCGFEVGRGQIVFDRLLTVAAAARDGQLLYAVTQCEGAPPSIVSDAKDTLRAFTYHRKANVATAPLFVTEAVHCKKKPSRIPGPPIGRDPKLVNKWAESDDQKSSDQKSSDHNSVHNSVRNSVHNSVRNSGQTSSRQTSNSKAEFDSLSQRQFVEESDCGRHEVHQRDRYPRRPRDTQRVCIGPRYDAMVASLPDGIRQFAPIPRVLETMLNDEPLELQYVFCKRDADFGTPGIPRPPRADSLEGRFALLCPWLLGLIILDRITLQDAF
eukprot:Selendium_serpulae@DN6274_c2_g2_i1.p1